MHPDRRTQAFLNSIDQLLTGHRPEIDERLMSDILGESPTAAVPRSPTDLDKAPRTGDTPSHQAIAERAYEIYVRTGRLSGTSVQNWLFARSELERSPRAEDACRTARDVARAR